MSASDHEKMSVTDQSSMSANAASVQYGTAQPFPLVKPIKSGSKQLEGLSSKFKFFVGEVTGLAFIVFTTLYIFSKPAWLVEAGVFKGLVDRTVKRTVDIFGAIVGLILSAPLMLVISVLIKLDSPGPVFYTQVRVGVNRRRQGRRYLQQDGASERRQRDRRRADYLGKPFKVIKFRTMVQDAEEKTGPVWATANDPRITRLGAFLRKSRLDEVPQFWSILVGHMSLVGPRPERPNFVRDLCKQVENYEKRLSVKPGLTGLAQVENGYDSSVASVTEKVKFDLQYIRRWSLWSDVRIMLRTVVVVFTGRGAY